MRTRKTRVVIDEELLPTVQSVLGTKTIKDTIERAFLEVLRARARTGEVEALSSLRGMDLNDNDVMPGAWRR